MSRSATRARRRSTTEAVRAFEGETWLVTGAPESPLAELADEVVQVAPEIEESYCHTKSYTAALVGCAALAGLDLSGVSAEVALSSPSGPRSRRPTTSGGSSLDRAATGRRPRRRR